MKKSILFHFILFCLLSICSSSHLLAYNDISCSLESSAFKATTAGSISTSDLMCDAPDWLATTNITQTTATWDWSPVSEAMSYSIQWRYPGGTWYNLGGGPWTNTWVNVGGLQPCTDYEWRVKSNCSYGYYSPWSYSASFTSLCSTCNAPDWVLTTEITENSAKLKWASVSGAQSYSVQIRQPNGSWSYVSGSPFSGTWTIVYNLYPNTTYEWRVRANCGGYYYSDWTYPISFTTLSGSSCDAPDWLNTANITQTTATWDWEPVSGATSYSLQWRYPGGTWYNLGGGPWSNTWVNVGGLQPCTSYEWRVKSNCSYGNYSPWSYSEGFTTLCYSCSTPTYLTTTYITETAAMFNWSPVSGAQNYSVQIRLPNGTWSFIPGSPFNNSPATVNGLTPGTTYEWRIRANCGYSNYSNWSYPVSFTTNGSFSCVAPSWLGTFNITQTTATWDWSPASGAVSYSVQWRYAGGTWYNLSGGPWSYTLLNIAGLQPGTAYEWRVRSNCPNGTHSDWSIPASFTTLGNTCSMPTGLSTTNITENTATFNWSPVSGAQSYSVQTRLPNGIWYYVPGSPFNSTSVTVNGFSSGTTYEWRVRANCGYGNKSNWTSPVSFTTLGSSSCYPPNWLATINITQTSATLDWSPVNGALNYSVEWRLAGGTWYDLGGPFSDSYANLTGLQAGTTYEWHVRTNCTNGDTSAWSVIQTFTTSTASGSPANDECPNAIQLTVNTSCMNTTATNVGATLSSPPPAGWCPSNWHKDVWFRFTMPDISNPTVTIKTTAGSLTDAVMEVYKGPDCANMTYLTCEDDNYNGNGSLMPVISITGNQNATIWVRLWGYGGITGTFNICVLDYESNNFTGNAPTSPDFISGDPLDPIESDFEMEQPSNNRNNESPSLRIAPNPASDVLNVTYSQTAQSIVVGIMLNDISGKIMVRKHYESRDINEFQEQLDVSGFSPGMYILQIITTSGIISEKISVVDN